MKTIIIFLFASSVIFAQKTKSFTQVTNLKSKKNTTVKNSTILSTNDAITYFADRASLIAACSETLVLEDFSGGPDNSGNTGCDGDISAAGDSCFPAGEIQPGIVITSSNTNVSEDYMVFTPAGFASNTVDVVGTNQFESFTIIKFPSGTINAVALDFYSLPFGNEAEVRIFGVSGLIDTTVITDLPGPVFFGFIASEPILSIEFQDLNNFVEMVGQVAFGSCDVVASINTLKDFNFQYYPNPVDNKLTVSANNNIDYINITNIFGQQVKQVTPFANTTVINLSNLSVGTYFVKTQINNKIGVFKFIKK